MASGRERPSLSNPTRTFWGILAAIGLFFVAMTVAALIAVQLGIISGPGESIDLGRWLMFEILIGSVIGLAAGALCRRLTASSRAPLGLAIFMFILALLEAAELSRHAGAGAIDAPVWLVWSAPMVLLLAIWLGGKIGALARQD